MSYLEKLKKIEFGLERIRKVDRSPSEYKYDLENFFIHCFHLKDHLIADYLIPEINSKIVEDYLNNNKHLRLCADLANRVKHLVLTRNIRDDAKFGKSEIDIYHAHLITASISLSVQLLKVTDGVVEERENPDSSNIENINPSISGLSENGKQHSQGKIDQRHQVTDNQGNVYDALTLAEKCYESWITFLKIHNLPVK